MENFTNLVPMERTGSLAAVACVTRSRFLDRGYNALIFPEGTALDDGHPRLTSSPSLDISHYTRVSGILPMYLDGTYEAMPKGRRSSRTAEVGARIGRFLEIEELEEMTKGMPRSKAYRLIALA
jgi:1-acyl-sn-glycerol-3-phosphate acyltransferase